MEQLLHYAAVKEDQQQREHQSGDAFVAVLFRAHGEGRLYALAAKLGHAPQFVRTALYLARLVRPVLVDKAVAGQAAL